MNASDRTYYLRHREAILVKRRAYREANLERIRESQHRYREANRERMRAYHATPEARESKRIRRARYSAEQRMAVMRHYSGLDVPACAACGVDDMDVLTIDHIFGGGRKHREEIKVCGAATAFHRWLIRNKYPTGFQVLCQNCNVKKYKQERRKEPFEPTRLPGSAGGQRFRIDGGAAF